MWKVLHFLNNNSVKHDIISHTEIRIKNYSIFLEDKQYRLKYKNEIIVTETNIETFISKLINYVKAFKDKV